MGHGVKYVAVSIEHLSRVLLAGSWDIPIMVKLSL